MKERPILMTAESVKAILDGRKTMTRRVIKPQPKLTIADGFYKANIQKLIEGGDRVCPYGQVGDRLWVRETCYKDNIRDWRYKADEALLPMTANYTKGEVIPSLFMPRWASRLTLEITGIRVERLQEITSEDCVAEGAEYMPNAAPREQRLTASQIVFAGLWDSLNAKRGYGWGKNPWCWIIKFDNIGVRVK